jgi:hypothetical protein
LRAQRGSERCAALLRRRGVLRGVRLLHEQVKDLESPPLKELGEREHRCAPRIAPPLHDAPFSCRLRDGVLLLRDQRVSRVTLLLRVRDSRAELGAFRIERVKPRCVNLCRLDEVVRWVKYVKGSESNCEQDSGKM